VPINLRRIWSNARCRGTACRRGYYFHVRNGDIFEDESGALLSRESGALPSREQAIAHGSRVAHELAEKGDWDGYSVDIADANGNEIARVPVARSVK
jgi:hypothetical protein